MCQNNSSRSQNDGHAVTSFSVSCRETLAQLHLNSRIDSWDLLLKELKDCPNLVTLTLSALSLHTSHTKQKKQFTIQFPRLRQLFLRFSFAAL